MTFEQELRNASDSVLHGLDRLRDLEEQKRAELPGTSRFVELAQKVEDLALEILRRAEREEDLAHASETRRRESGDLTRPIEEIPPQGRAPAVPPRDLASILDDWRDAERRLTAAGPGSEGARQAAADARRLRDEYARAHRARAAGSEPGGDAPGRQDAPGR